MIWLLVVQHLIGFFVYHRLLLNKSSDKYLSTLSFTPPAVSFVTPTSCSTSVNHSQILLLELAEEVLSSSVVSVAVPLSEQSLFLGGSGQSIQSINQLINQ